MYKRSYFALQIVLFLQIFFVHVGASYSPSAANLKNILSSIREENSAVSDAIPVCRECLLEVQRNEETEAAINAFSGSDGSTDASQPDIVSLPSVAQFEQNCANAGLSLGAVEASTGSNSGSSSSSNSGSTTPSGQTPSSGSTSGSGPGANANTNNINNGGNTNGAATIPFSRVFFLMGAVIGAFMIW
ncbi:hypothetical protein BDZ97DRAFT_2044789 [Flammula alnicola]|nr:hypothetical protein BDZ97DRAFT_2044789 [Flammula alnicola]